MKTPVWVIGGSNQVAAWLIPQLLAAEYCVTVDSRAAQPPWIAPDHHLRWHSGRDPQGVDDRPERVVYIGPMDRFSAWWPDAGRGGHVVAFSSTSRFSKAASPNAGERAVAQSLATGEQLLMSAAATARVTILRPTLVYGAGLDLNLTRLARWIRRLQVMPMPGPGAGLRQPVHGRDLARAVLQVLQSGAQGPYTLPGGSTLSYRNMLERVFASLGLKPRFVPVPRALTKPALGLLRLRPHWADLTPAMLERMEQDLVYDDTAARRDFGYDSQPFEPTAQDWIRLDQRGDNPQFHAP